MDNSLDRVTSTTTLRDLPEYRQGRGTGPNMSRDGFLKREHFERELRAGSNMNVESNRVASFTAPFWHKNSPVSIYRLANAGLYSTGNGDEVKCFSCLGIISNWKNDDSPKRRHKCMYPHCRFVSGLDMRNISNIKYVPKENKEKSETQLTRLAIYSRANHVQEVDESSIKTSEDGQSQLNMVGRAFLSEKTRLATFKQWPLSSPVDPYELSASGFYMINRTTVQCFACFGKILSSSWKVGDRPMNKHRLMYPSCPFVKDVDIGNRPMTREEKTDVLKCKIQQSSASTDVRNMRVKFQEYKSYESRLMSFKNWTLSYVIRPTVLANAGFFYSNKHDLVTCFCCGLRLEAWNPGDDAWSEHASWSPNCPWVLKKKGWYFVNSVNQST